jgi:RNA polymerase sigma factor (sigma-70 family)
LRGASSRKGHGRHTIAGLWHFGLEVRIGRPYSRSNPLLDSAGFTRLYELNAKKMLLFFTRRVYQPEIALDLTAETFAQAFLSRRRFRGQTDAEAQAWLYGIARHELGRYFRRGRAERRAIARLGVDVPALSDAELRRIEELAELDDMRAALAEGLARVSADQRAALKLRVVDERPYAEVARRLGISEQAARARVSRGLRALSRALDARSAPKESR